MTRHTLDNRAWVETNKQNQYSPLAPSRLAPLASAPRPQGPNPVGGCITFPVRIANPVKDRAWPLFADRTASAKPS
jgi:hypothetical protein